MNAFWEQINHAEFSEQEAIQVYQTNVMAAKLMALDEKFQLVKNALPANLFKGLIHQYARYFSSTCDSLNDYGDSFPDFIQEITPYNSKLIGMPHLYELAQLDSLISKSFFAEDDVHFNSPEPDAQCFIAKHAFALNTNFLKHVFSSTQALSAKGYSIKALFKLVDENRHRVSDQPKSISLLVYRVDFDVYVMPITKVEYDFFLLSLAGKPIFLMDQVIEGSLTSKEQVEMMVKFRQLGILLGCRDAK